MEQFRGAQVRLLCEIPTIVTVPSLAFSADHLFSLFLGCTTSTVMSPTLFLAHDNCYTAKPQLNKILDKDDSLCILYEP